MDQVIGETAGFLARHTYDTGEQVVDLLDATCHKAACEKQRGPRVPTRNASATKLDECALWKEWVSFLGISFKGLRILTLRGHFYTSTFMQ